MIPMQPKHVVAPTPAEAISPAPEAVLENDLPQMPEPGDIASTPAPESQAISTFDKIVGGLVEPFNYPNDIASTPAPESQAIRASDKFVGGLVEPFNYPNDLDEGMKRDLIKPLIDSIKEKLSQETLSANDVAKCLNVSHTRITRNFPNGTKLSYILENLPKPRSIDPEKLVGRLSEHAKRELLAKLQQELA